MKKSLLWFSLIALISGGVHAEDNHLNAKTADNQANQDNVADKSQLFYECAAVQTNIARLACFDKVAQSGKLPSFTNEKQPIDLEKTLVKTFKGEPQLVLVTPSTDNDDNAIDNDGQFQLNSDNAHDTNLSISIDKFNDNQLGQNEQYILSTVGIKDSDISKYSPLSLAYDLDKNSEIGKWKPRPHNPMYLLPIQVHTNLNRSPSTPNQEVANYNKNERRNAELKLQFSTKTKVAEDLFNTRSDLWFGYTQQSHWQVYNEDHSRPFRATDYQPEIFITQPVTASLPLNGRLRMLGAGFIHHSNGEDDPLSRSWNRAYMMAGAEWNNLTVVPKLWARVNAKTTTKPDDNPDITDYWGFGEIKAYYDLNNKNSLSTMVRGNLGTQKGAIELGLIHQLDNNVNVYLQVFHGYGESIIDYNHKDTTVGMGIMLNDWRGL